MCVCFALSGPPLGSTAWRGEGIKGEGEGQCGGGGGGSLEVPSFTLPPQIELMCVYECACCPPSVPE